MKAPCKSRYMMPVLVIIIRHKNLLNERTSCKNKTRKSIMVLINFKLTPTFNIIQMNLN